MRVLCLGYGGIGQVVCDTLLKDRRFELSAVVDPAKAGEQVGDIKVVGDPNHCSDSDATVGLIATSSKLEQIYEQIEGLLALGLDVVSTSEELSFPWLKNEAVSRDLDQLARRLDRTVVSSGVNPGFLMDALPVMIGSGSIDHRSVRVNRNVNLSRRRKALQEKVGVGMALADWEERGGSDRFGHVGLVESAHLVALGLGWEPGTFQFHREPVLSSSKVTGIREVVELNTSDDHLVTLSLVFDMAADDRDSIHIEGRPPLHLVFEGGVHGDVSTIARIVHAARVVNHMARGLRLPLEIPAWASGT